MFFILAYNVYTHMEKKPRQNINNKTNMVNNIITRLRTKIQKYGLQPTSFYCDLQQKQD